MLVLVQVNLWEEAIHDKDAAIVCQNELVTHLTEQKRQMASDLATVSSQCTTYKHNLRACQVCIDWGRGGG